MRIIDIIKDVEFYTEANVAFRAALVQLKSIGKGDTTHKTPISDKDLELLYSSGVFDQNTPQGLQRKVWFELMLFICRRGREYLRELKKEHFKVKEDSDGKQYVYQATDELTKKTREDNQESRVDTGRMYATDKPGCPVQSFQKYISKLHPECDALFQTPKSKAEKNGSWYKKMPMGQCTLGNMMPTIRVILR